MDSSISNFGNVDAVSVSSREKVQKHIVMFFFNKMCILLFSETVV